MRIAQRASWVLPVLLTALLSACGNLAFVRPTDQQRDTTPVNPGTLMSNVPIEIDFTGSTRARSIVLDGNIDITTAPAAGFVTAPGAGQNGWDRVSGKYPLGPGTHTLTASAEYLNFARQVQTITKTVTFKVVGPMPDLLAVETSSVETFQGGTPVSFEIRVYNQGPSPANNIPLKFYTNAPAVMSQLTTQGGFSCAGISGGPQRLEVHCTGGNIPGFQQANVNVTVKPTTPVPSGGNFTLFGNLDEPQSIDEADETNNTFTKGVLVVP